MQGVGRSATLPICVQDFQQLLQNPDVALVRKEQGPAAAAETFSHFWDVNGFEPQHYPDFQALAGAVRLSALPHVSSSSARCSCFKEHQGLDCVTCRQPTSGLMGAIACIGAALMCVSVAAGDASDNIPGVKSIGVKRATDLVKQYATLENMFTYVEGMVRCRCMASCMMACASRAQQDAVTSVLVHDSR